MTTVLCIGGLDPAGRAGLFADARAVEGQGARPIGMATALTFQSSRRVDGFVPVEADVLFRQLQTVLRDEPIGAVKIGQLGSVENVEVVLSSLRSLWTSRPGATPRPPLVVDTPLVSSSGAELFPVSQAEASYRPLLEEATLVTPNAPEALLLAGKDVLAGKENEAGRSEVEAAARSLPASAVLLTGGHVEGAKVVDVLFSREGERTEWQSPRLPGAFRGTGCRLASAIAARLALGEELETAVTQGRAWLQRQLRDVG